MAIYGINRQTSSTTVATAALELRTASTDRGKVERIQIVLHSAVNLVWGIGRPAAIGVTPTSPVTWLATDPAEPVGTVQTALAWGTGPTAPANFFKRVGMRSASQGIILTFPTLLIIAVSSSIVLWNITTSAVAQVNVLGEE